MKKGFIPHDVLTARADGVIILDRKKRIGCIIREVDGWGAWSLTKKIGKHPDPAAAEKAVRGAAKPPPKPKSPKSWEVRS